MNAQELVTIIPWTFIAQILNLFLQMYLVKRFLFKPINEVLEKRRARAEAQLTDAADAKRSAEEMKATYEKNLAEANANAKDIIQTAQKQATLQSEAIVKEARAQAASIKQHAEAEINLEKEKAFQEMKNEIGGIAMEIAGKVIEREISEKDHQKLIDEVIENVGDLS